MLFSGTVTNYGSLRAINGTLAFNGGLNNFGSIQVLPGGSISVPNAVQLSTGNTFFTSGATSLTGFINTGGTATVGGTQQWAANSVFINSSGNSTFTTTSNGSLAVFVGGGTVTFSGTDKLSGLAISPGATSAVRSSASGPTVLIVPTLSVSGALDLTGEGLDVPGGTLAAVTAMAAQGYASGRWNGGGIDSSTAAANPSHNTAIGLIQNNQGGTPIFSSTNLFDGVAPAASDVLAKYTYYGDANLDGKVDGSDYTLIDNGYNLDAAYHSANPTGTAYPATGWFNGDFNYDGVVDGSDYSLIDNAFNTQAGTLSANVAALTAASTDQIAGLSAVPEPATGSLLSLMIGFAIVSSRRIRKSVARIE